MLTGKTVVLGVTGSIAAYKAANLVSLLKKQGANVHVVMTRNAAEFISPITFETLTGNRCVVDMFDRSFKREVEHISLAKAADLLVIAPATANFIAKAANGIADDMLTTVILAAKSPKLVAPAMNTAMYENDLTRGNIEKLSGLGWKFIEPTTGLLACGDTGKGKMPEPEFILDHILLELAREKDMAGLKVLVTAGPTQEAIDPVRYITNHSSGKMGYAIAEACALRGAEVKLVSGRTALECPVGVERIDVVSSEDMYKAVLANIESVDMLFKAAAVSDYTPAITADHKLKKADSDMKIELKRTHDILAAVSEIRRDDQVICGFAMETENLIENSRGKLERKKLDMICANSLKTEGAGFKSDTNVVTIITEDEMIELGMMSKFDTADRIVTAAIEIRKERVIV